VTTAPRAPRWSGEPRRTAAPRRQLGFEQIVGAALRILDADGLDGVSMRRVAQELDTGAASLYAHVTNKDDLLEAVFDRIAAEVPIPEIGPGNWRDQLIEYYVSLRNVLVSHRDIARFSLARIPTGPAALAVTERCIGIMNLSKLPTKVIAWACDALFLYVTANAYEESIYESRFPNATPEQMAEYFKNLLGFFADLPTDRFPNLRGMSGPMLEGDGEQRFRFGLEVFLRGLEAYAAAHPEL
jgi:AcrR family transcriptional regulator